MLQLNAFELRPVVFENAYRRLNECTRFELLGKGRSGAIAVDCGEPFESSNGWPIVRTTTQYSNPSQLFCSAHYELRDAIRAAFDDPTLQFNNCMVELYEPSYRKMGFHSDQSLDLSPDSFICLFSCYENDSNHPADYRKLVIQEKASGHISERVLSQCSAVLFSISSNQSHLHKIILDSQKAKNRWIGVTFRLSKTFVRELQGEENAVHFMHNARPMRLASSEEMRQMFHLKGQENANQDGPFEFPEALDYTISKSDFLEPVPFPFSEQRT